MLALAAPAAASSGWSDELAHEIMSPYCPGRSLVECPSEKAVELRIWLKQQEDEGRTREEIEARLAAEFGELHQRPRAAGFGLWAYLVPAAALLAGGLLVFVFLRRQAGPAPVAPPAAPRDPDLEREIERELGGS